MRQKKNKWEIEFRSMALNRKTTDKQQVKYLQHKKTNKITKFVVVANCLFLNMYII